MRALLASTVVALLMTLSPASAMCGGSGQRGASAQGGMCGKPSATTEDAFNEKPGMSKRQSGMMMCGCCKNMASMGGMKDEDPHKGMDMPKQ